MTLPLLLDLPGRDEAREAAQRELAKPAYQAAKPSWLQRLLTWLQEELSRLLDKASGSFPGGGWGLLLLVLVVAALVVLLVVRLRPVRATRPGLEVFGVTRERTAQEHRDLADALAASGAHREAGQERFRAVVRELESRGVLDARPGRTADEVAWEAGAALPPLREALLRGARLFDDLRYGDREGDASSYAVMVALDDEVRTARLALA